MMIGSAVSIAGEMKRSFQSQEEGYKEEEDGWCVWAVSVWSYLI